MIEDSNRDDWVTVLEKMLADLRALNAYLRGEIERAEYCKRVSIAEVSQEEKVVRAGVVDLNRDLTEHKSLSVYGHA